MGNRKSWGLGLTLFTLTVYGKDFAPDWEFALLMVTWPFDGRALLQMGYNKSQELGVWFGALWFPGRYYPIKEAADAHE